MKITINRLKTLGGPVAFSMADLDEDWSAVDESVSARRLPDNRGVRLCVDPIMLYHRGIDIEGDAIPCTGSVLAKPGFMHYIPNVKAHYRNGLSTSSHVLLDSEWLTIFSANEYRHIAEPSDFAIDTVRQLLRQTTHLAEIEQSPRDVQMLALHDDRLSALNVPNGLMQDYGWLLRHWPFLMGGEMRGGWYEGVCSRGAHGYKNWHYDELTWLILWYINAPSSHLWRLIVECVIRHCDFGRVHRGTAMGLAQYEKGQHHIGENHAPKIEKQWSRGMILFDALVDGHPITGEAIDKMLRWLESTPAIWSGYWGARIPARWLDELLLYWLVHNRPEKLKAQALRLIMSCARELDRTNMVWVNQGNNGNAPESPWMQVQLIHWIFRWYEHCPDLEEKSGLSKDDLCGVMETVWNEGMIDVGKYRVSKYRFWTKDIMPDSMHITAFFQSALRYCSQHDPARFGGRFASTYELLWKFAGSSLSDIMNNSPRPLNALDMRIASEGPGWGDKVVSIYLSRFI